MRPTAVTLPRIDGLDTAAGLKFFAGRADVYLQALRTFASLYAGGLPAAGGSAAGAGADAAALRQAAHALAGASLVLGAAALGAQAQRLQSLLATAANPRQIDEQRADVQRALALLVQQLQARLPAP